MLLMIMILELRTTHFDA